MHGNYAAVTAMQKCGSADHASALASTTASRATSRRSPRTPRSSTPTSIPPRSARTGRSTFRSSATRSRSSPSWRKPSSTTFARDGPLDLSAWVSEVTTWQHDAPDRSTTSPRTGRSSRSSSSIASTPRLQGEAIVVTGVGQHQMWASQLMPCNKPNSFITSGGLGTMGFARPRRLRRQGRTAGRAGRRDRRRRLFPDDGAGARDRNDREDPVHGRDPQQQHLGMVRQWQELFYDERYSEVHLPQVPDYVKLAEAYGGVGLRATTPDEVDNVIDKALGIDDRPCVIDFRVDPERDVLPDGSGRCVERRHHPRPQRSRHLARPIDPRSGMGRVTSDSHALRPRREQAGRARPHLRTVRPARLQHRLARRRRDRGSRRSRA